MSLENSAIQEGANQIEISTRISFNGYQLVFHLSVIRTFTSSWFARRVEKGKGRRHLRQFLHCLFRDRLSKRNSNISRKDSFEWVCRKGHFWGALSNATDHYPIQESQDDFHVMTKISTSTPVLAVIRLRDPHTSCLWLVSHRRMHSILSDFVLPDMDFETVDE
jgi:hypothetical protein